MLSLTRVPAFTSPQPIPSCRPRPTLHAPLVCTVDPPPPSSEIPSGARLEPVPVSDSPLERRLATLRFGYEGAGDVNSSPSAPCRLRYRCPHGHVVCALRGSPACRFCPTCSYQMAAPGISRRGRRLSLCQVQALAYVKGGSLVSTQYKDARTPLVWQCAKGHLWKARVTNIRNSGSWCPECARQKKKLTMDDMRQIARERGGECLSQEYIGEYVKMKWRCKEGHEFLLAPNNIRRKPNGARKPSWCKICAKKKAAMEREAKKEACLVVAASR